MSRRNRGIGATLSLALALGAAVPAMWAYGADGKETGLSAACKRPLNILLTNDDGYSAESLDTVYEALTAAGHNVTVVAPLTAQSGKGGAMTYSGVLDVTQPVADDPNVYAVSGTPSDSVALALDAIVDERPDLVVSGINPGANVSRSTNHSGTVAAATTAIDRGVPAIAVSAAYRGEVVRSDDFSKEPRYDDTADLVVKLVQSLKRRAPKCERLMPANSGLNVNYPGTHFKGVRQSTFGTRDPKPTTYTETSAGEYAIGYSLDPLYAAYADQDSQTRIDYKLMARGYATITPIDGDMSIVPTRESRLKFLRPVLRDLR